MNSNLIKMSLTLPYLSGRRSTTGFEKKEVNIVDFLFHDQDSGKEALIYSKLQEQENQRKSFLPMIQKLNLPRKSFRINRSDSQIERRNHVVARKSLVQVLGEIRERNKSFDKYKFREKSRLKNLEGKRDTLRVISNEINYLKNDVIDHLVGISLVN